LASNLVKGWVGKGEEQVALVFANADAGGRTARQTGTREPWIMDDKSHEDK
jgi:hypothetical protein